MIAYLYLGGVLAVLGTLLLDDDLCQDDAVVDLVLVFLWPLVLCLAVAYQIRDIARRMRG